MLDQKLCHSCSLNCDERQKYITNSGVCSSKLIRITVSDWAKIEEVTNLDHYFSGTERRGLALWALHTDTWSFLG